MVYATMTTPRGPAAIVFVDATTNRSTWATIRHLCPKTQASARPLLGGIAVLRRLTSATPTPLWAWNGRKHAKRRSSGDTHRIRSHRRRIAHRRSTGIGDSERLTGTAAVHGPVRVLQRGDNARPVRPSVPHRADRARVCTDPCSSTTLEGSGRRPCIVNCLAAYDRFRRPPSSLTLDPRSVLISYRPRVDFAGAIAGAGVFRCRGGPSVAALNLPVHA